MTFVRQRFWHERSAMPSLGKVHWLVAPWTTACGREIVHEEDWLDAGWPDMGDVCKSCGRARKEAE